LPHIWQAVSPCSLLPSKEGPTLLFDFLHTLWFIFYFILYTHTHKDSIKYWTSAGSIEPCHDSPFYMVRLNHIKGRVVRSNRTRLFIFTQILRYWKNQWIINIEFSLKNLLQYWNYLQYWTSPVRIFESIVLISNKLLFTPNGSFFCCLIFCVNYLIFKKMNKTHLLIRSYNIFNKSIQCVIVVSFLFDYY